MDSAQPKNCSCAPQAASRCSCADRPRNRLTFRQERQIAAVIFLAFMIAAGLIAAFIGGCTSDVEHYYARSPMIGNQGSSWEAVLPTPFVSGSPSYADASMYPEFSRYDEALNNRPPIAQLASNQWPEAPRPDLAFPRYIDLQPRARTLLWFESTGSYTPYWYSSVYNSPRGSFFFAPPGR